MILKDILDFPVKVISGYKGTAEVRIAIDGGELDGGCWTWDGPTAGWVQRQNMTVVVQGLPKPHPLFPKASLVAHYAKTDEARELVEAGIHNVNAMLVPYVLPPGTPKDHVQTLGKAFMDTMKDPQFIEEAKTANLKIDPVSASEMRGMVEGFYTLRPSVAAKLRDIMFLKN
jgi:tripartite-type tricarboxylate transporter receptor subunit TctC